MDETDTPNPVPLYPIMPTSDHDALVTLVSEMRQLRTEVKDIKSDIRDVKDNVSNRVNDLEQEKLDKAEAMRLLSEADKIHQDFETRLREDRTFIDNLKGKYAILAVVASVMISIVVSLTVYGLQSIIKH